MTTKKQRTLVEIVFQKGSWKRTSDGSSVHPFPIGAPEILSRYETCDNIKYFTIDTIPENPRFRNSLEEDILNIAPKHATAYSLGDEEDQHSGVLESYKYAVQFYKI